METFVSFLQQLNPLLIYITLFSIAYIENLFPPSPSDIMIVAGGYLIGLGHVDFITTLIVSTLGSTLGFMSMYKIGDWFGIRIIETNKIKFLPLESIHKVEEWFRIYGYWLIVINRFLSGTRAVVGFFAGMSEVKAVPTAVLCFISALTWNAVLLYAGTLLGRNWQQIGIYLSTYSQIVISLIVIFSIAGIIWWFRSRPKSND